MFLKKLSLSSCLEYVMSFSIICNKYILKLLLRKYILLKILKKINSCLEYVMRFSIICNKYILKLLSKKYFLLKIIK